MNNDISLTLIILSNIFVIFSIIVHIASCRFVSKREGFKSSQMFLIKLVVYMNIPLCFGIVTIACLESRSFLDFLYMAVYGLCIFNGLLYAYFHFFNMSETARRVRILLHIYNNNSITIDQIKDDYSNDQMIISRLGRLVSMGEIREDSVGTYHISTKRLLLFAHLFDGLRKFFRN